jgi:localization factor PodJL
MQPDLPWNVAGIPPEAREAARAAARREGLSVGEWLTRRILRSLTENGEAGSWHRLPEYDYRTPSDYRPLADSGPTARDTDEMLARVSRSETETQGAYRRIEEQLKSLATRLEAAEKSQSENCKAMSQAATEINTAAKEQAQAFDQLGAHVVGLGERLSRVERSAASDGVKDAVKGLHAGLSRLADQIADNTNQSAAQIAKLANNIESIAGKLGEVRHEAEHGVRALSSRIAGIEERFRAADGSSRAAADKLDQAVANLQAFEARIRGAEGTSQSIADKFDRTIANMESAARSARADDQAELQRQAAVINQLSDALDKLATRINASEAQTAGAVARLEHQIAESRQADQPVDRRLQGIEHALAEIAGRLESAERNATSSARSVEENLRSVSMRLDAADKRHREAMSELHAAAQSAPQPVAAPQVAAPPAPSAVAAAPVSPPPAAAPIPPPPGEIFDLPPFPDSPAAPSFAPADGDFPSFLSAPPAFASETEADPLLLTQPAPTETADSYIAAARRSAKAAAAAEAQQGMRGGFSWGAAPMQASVPPKSNVARYLLVAGILFIAIAAVVAGILLSRGLVGTLPTQTPRLHSEAQANPPPPAEPLAPPTTAATPQPSTAPGSPVIPRTTKKVETKPAAAAAARPATPAPSHNAQPSLAQQLAQPTTPLQRLTAQANQGNAKAELLVGLKYLDGDGVPVNEAEAAKWLERAANQGEAIAAYRLGTLYERGHGVPAVAAKAVQWYLLAAKLGNRKAMHNLAVAYAEGSGTPKDLAQAAQWFSRAASLGLADSQFNLAVLYERGMGVQQSLIDAYKWYAIAAAQGDTESKARLDVLSTQLNADERAAAQKAASEFRPLPVDRNANVPPDPSMAE